MDNSATFTALFSSDAEFTSEMQEIVQVASANVYQDTTEAWNSQTSYIAKKNSLYIYTDYYKNGDEVSPAMKIGDGTTYLIDLPFLNAGVQQALAAHVADDASHVSAADRAFWNAKMRCYLDDTGNFIFTTD